MSFFKKIFWDSWNLYEKCSKCKKPETSESNYKRLKYLIVGSTVGGAAGGAAALPLLGFGAGGIAAGSAAASWQSSIGAVAAGSLFATLQSLGATGLGVLIFGAVGTGLGVLGSIATRLGWCTCEADRIQEDKPLYDFIKRIQNAIKQTVWNSWNYYIQCPACYKPAICESNLRRLVNLTIGITATCDAKPEKFAASWKKAMSAVADGKLFRTMQSLGTNGVRAFYSGTMDEALEVLRSNAANLEWCSCGADSKDLEMVQHFKNCSKCNKMEVCLPNLEKLRENVAENIPAMMNLFRMLEYVADDKEAREKAYTLLYGDEEPAIRVLTSLASCLGWCICSWELEVQKIMTALNVN